MQCEVEVTRMVLYLAWSQLIGDPYIKAWDKNCCYDLHAVSVQLFEISTPPPPPPPSPRREISLRLPSHDTFWQCHENVIHTFKLDL